MERSLFAEVQTGTCNRYIIRFVKVHNDMNLGGKGEVCSNSLEIERPYET